MTPSALASRPWRNNNPGDLRTLGSGHWIGQVRVDNAPGGPFAVFDTRTDGWRALAMNLLAYQDDHGLHTVRGIIGRFAPSLENDTGGYISLVCGQIGRGPDQTISVHDGPTMLALCKAIALAEGSARLAWPPDEITAGLRLAGIVGPVATQPPLQGGMGTRPMAVASAAMTRGDDTADLNDASLASIQGATS